jgi:hypothetical protein
MPAKYEPTHKVHCTDCKWTETYETRAFAESAVRLHNKDEHPGVIVTLDGIILERNKNVWTITMTEQDLKHLDGGQLSDTVAYMASVAKNGEI